MATVNKRKDNGKWEVRYFDPSGKRRSKSFKMKKAADAYRLKIETELDAGEHIAPRDSATVGECAKAYLDALDQQVKAGDWKPVSYFREEQHLRLHVLPTLAAVRMSELKEAHVSNLIFNLRKGGAGATRPLSPVTVDHSIAAFARMGDFAVRQRMARRNVIRAGKKWKEHRFKRKPIRLFTMEECHAIMAYFENVEARADRTRLRTAYMGRALVYLALLGGLRSGEARGLAFDAMERADGLLDVRQQLDNFDKVTDPKTEAGVRKVPIAEPLAAALDDWRRLYYRPNPHGLFFLTNRGTPFGKSCLHNYIWKPALKELGLDQPDADGRTFHFHALRHFASALMVKHMPLADVPQIMGHKHFDTTLMEYAQPVLTAPAKQAAFAAIASDLKPTALLSDANMTQAA